MASNIRALKKLLNQIPVRPDIKTGMGNGILLLSSRMDDFTKHPGGDVEAMQELGGPRLCRCVAELGRRRVGEFVGLVAGQQPMEHVRYHQE